MSEAWCGAAKAEGRSARPKEKERKEETREREREEERGERGGIGEARQTEEGRAAPRRPCARGEP